MQIVSVEELINLTILPYDLYNQNGDALFRAGEILTPGKILQLRYVPILYKQENDDDDFEIQEFEEPEEIAEEIPIPQKVEKGQTPPPQKITHSKTTNKAGLSPKLQTKICDMYNKAVAKSQDEDAYKNQTIYEDIRDIIIEETLGNIDNVVYKSELKIVGDYNEVHGINVSILSAALAHKMFLSDKCINDITLAALLHDIGKIKIPSQILEKSTLTPRELQVIHLHPQISYKIIKQDLGLPENIARIALEHHEKNDGTGYPRGLSGEFLSMHSQIVSVCNLYDEIISNKSTIKVKNAKDAVKTMMGLGSKFFMPKVLYSFVYMSNYGDLTPVPMNNNV